MIDFERDWHRLEDLARFAPSHRHRRRLILYLCRRIQFKTVLDVGCGNGELLREIAAVRSCIATGIDSSLDVISRNQARFPGIRFITMDAEHRHLEESFDLVICADTLEHVSSPERFLSMIRRMCCRDLILTTPAARPRPLDREFGHHRHFTEIDLKQLLIEGGFRVVHSFSWGFPFMAAYRGIINLFPSYFLDRFSGGPYGRGRRILAELANALFYLNVRGLRGPQAFVHAQLPVAIS